MGKLFVGLVVLVALLASTNALCAEEITIVGTGSGASVLKAVGEAFMQKNAGVKIIVPESIGSGGGIKAVGADKNVMGRVARPIKDKEKPLGLTYYEYANLPIIFYVNKNVTIDSLTAKQACDIYSGAVGDWKDVGGQDGKINVIRREDGDSSLEILQKKLPGFKDIKLTEKSKTTFSDPETLELCGAKKNTIAFGTYADVIAAENVKVLTLDGKKPTDADYPCIGKIALIWKEQNNKGSVKAFIDFVKSGNAADAIQKAGAVPIAK